MGQSTVEYVRKQRGVVKFLVAGFGLAAIAVCGHSHAQSQELKGNGIVLELKGTLENSPEYLILYKETHVGKRQTDFIDSIPVRADHTFEYTADLEPHLYKLDVGNGKSVRLAIGSSSTIVLAGDVGGTNTINITGSVDTDQLSAYESYRKSLLENTVYPIRERIKALKKEDPAVNSYQIDSLGQLELQRVETYRADLMRYIRSEMDISPAVYATSIRWTADGFVPFLDSLSVAFSKHYPGTELALRIRETVEQLKRTAIGNTAPEIILPNPTGDTIKLTEQLGRYTLIDFWASWCAPCRRESALLNTLYDSYNDEGFQIFSVSIDERKASWLAAIEKDNRTWVNVSDLKGYTSPFSLAYSVSSIPFNVIIDSTGKIVARNVQGEELKRLVETLFEE